jgi:hypothetical protein
MRITICLGYYTAIFSSATNYEFYFEWDNFFADGGYPRIVLDWGFFSFSVDDF